MGFAGCVGVGQLSSQGALEAGSRGGGHRRTRNRPALGLRAHFVFLPRVDNRLCGSGEGVRPQGPRPAIQYAKLCKMKIRAPRPKMIRSFKMGVSGHYTEHRAALRVVPRDCTGHTSLKPALRGAWGNCIWWLLPRGLGTGVTAGPGGRICSRPGPPGSGSWEPGQDLGCQAGRLLHCQLQGDQSRTPTW